MATNGRNATPEADTNADAAELELRVVRLRPNARLPARQSELASGFDLHACLGDGEGVVLGTMPTLVPTGLGVAAPPGADVQLRPRSGLSLRGVMAVFGTLDADYRGELFVSMYCLPGAEGHIVRDGDRIAQLVVSRLAPVRWSEVADLDATARGAGGHGSTGR
jgi:dUTP pyrophosphatase